MSIDDIEKARRNRARTEKAKSQLDARWSAETHSGEEKIKSEIADLDAVAYDQKRQSIADRHGVRTSTLDKLYKQAAKGEDDSGGKTLDIPDTEPCGEPVDGSSLLSDLKQQFARFVVADDEVLTAAALWSIFTYIHDGADVSPPAHISAPEKRCGKSVLLGCFSKVVCRPLPVSNITGAALFRSVEKWSPCLLIDEVDSFLGDSEDIRGIINSGFDRSNAYVVRCVGDDNEPRIFETFAPKVLCGIGKLPGTVMDRSIPLKLRRKRPSERAERLRHSDKTEWSDLRQRMARWAQDNAGAIQAYRPEPIHGLNDRACDAWEPLLQIAATAGDEWLSSARDAAIAMHGAEEETPSIQVELLSDIKTIFDERGSEKIFSADLIEQLIEDDESPWATWNRGSPMTLRQLAKKLEPFGIKSKMIRIGRVTGKKGFDRSQFDDALRRYVSPDTPSQRSTHLQPLQDNGSSDFEKSTAESRVDHKKISNPLRPNGCRHVDHTDPQRQEQPRWSDETREEL